MSSIGAHEVIIDSPEHEFSPEKSDGVQMFRVLTSYKIRLSDLKNDLRLRYGLIFKNVGVEAGASLSHPHSQIIATPIIPKHVKEELSNCKEYFDLKERCLFCDIINEEIERKKRIVAETEPHIVWAPYASRFPFETWILPKKHNACFTCVTEGELQDLGKLLQQVIRCLFRVLPSPPFNYVFHTRPFRLSKLQGETTMDEDYHWHIEIIPRLTKVAGFEWGSGFYINPSAPEDVASVMREAIF
jgi:UDPglucose--hexose-1-phosphate uridylyltransferase